MNLFITLLVNKTRKIISCLLDIKRCNERLKDVDHIFKGMDYFKMYIRKKKCIDGVKKNR